MGQKKKNGLHGKVFVSALVVFSLTCSNVVAKAADIPVNQVFSENVTVEKVEKSKFLFESETFCLLYTSPSPRD